MGKPTVGGLSPLAEGTHIDTTVLQRRFSRFYPRWRGEHWSSSFHGGKGRGFIPAGAQRERRTNKYERRFIPRFIPAGAGTQAMRIFSWLLAVYPRWRGNVQ